MDLSTEEVSSSIFLSQWKTKFHYSSLIFEEKEDSSKILGEISNKFKHSPPPHFIHVTKHLMTMCYRFFPCSDQSISQSVRQSLTFAFRVRLPHYLLNKHNTAVIYHNSSLFFHIVTISYGTHALYTNARITWETHLWIQRN